MGGLTSEGGQSAGSLRIAYPFETVFKLGCVGYYIERCRLLQKNGDFGNSRDVVGSYAGGTAPLNPRLNFLGVGVVIVSTACKPHAMKPTGAPVVQIDDLTPVAHFAHTKICIGL